MECPFRKVNYENLKADTKGGRGIGRISLQLQKGTPSCTPQLSYSYFQANPTGREGQSLKVGQNFTGGVAGNGSHQTEKGE